MVAVIECDLLSFCGDPCTDHHEHLRCRAFLRSLLLCSMPCISRSFLCLKAVDVLLFSPKMSFLLKNNKFFFFQTSSYDLKFHNYP